MSDFDFSTMDFGQAEDAQGGSELIPDGTLAWAIFTVRPHNLDQGLVLVPSKSSDGAYIDAELTILEGPFARRKVWDRIGMVGSEKWVARGRSCVRSIIEVGNGMVEFPQGHPNYRLGTKTRTTGEVALMELDGLRCAVKIGIEKGKDGFPDKNTIRQYLSPRPDSETHKTFMRLVNGDTQSPLAKTATAGQTKPSWASAGTKTAPNPAQSPASRPSWAGAAPAAGAKPDKIPF